MSEESNSGCGCGFIAISMIVTTILAILKLTGIILWSWLWVSSPFLIALIISTIDDILSIGLSAGFFGLTALFASLGDWFDKKKTEGVRDDKTDNSGNRSTDN